MNVTKHYSDEPRLCVPGSQMGMFICFDQKTVQTVACKGKMSIAFCC